MPRSVGKAAVPRTSPFQAAEPTRLDDIACFKASAKIKFVYHTSVERESGSAADITGEATESTEADISKLL
jgi:hypothetical protein